MTFLTQHHLWN